MLKKLNDIVTMMSNSTSDNKELLLEGGKGFLYDPEGMFYTFLDFSNTKSVLNLLLDLKGTIVVDTLNKLSKEKIESFQIVNDTDLIINDVTLTRRIDKDINSKYKSSIKKIRRLIRVSKNSERLILATDEFKDLSDKNEFFGIRLLFKKYLITKVSKISKVIFTKYKLKNFKELVEISIFTTDNEKITHYGVNMEFTKEKRGEEE